MSYLASTYISSIFSVGQGTMPVSPTPSNPTRSYHAQVTPVKQGFECHACGTFAHDLNVLKACPCTPNWRMVPQTSVTGGGSPSSGSNVSAETLKAIEEEHSRLAKLKELQELRSHLHSLVLEKLHRERQEALALQQLKSQSLKAPASLVSPYLISPHVACVKDWKCCIT